MIDEQRYRALIQQLATGGITGNNNYNQLSQLSQPMGYMNGGGIGSMMQPRMNFKLGGGEFEENQTIGLNNIINSDLLGNTNMQTAGLIPEFMGGTNDEEDAAQDAAQNSLEQIQDLRQQENSIKSMGEGAIEIKQNELKNIENQIKSIKNQNKDSQQFKDIGGLTANKSTSTLDSILNSGMNIMSDVGNSIFSPAAASEITPSNNIQSSGIRSMADVAGPSTIDRFSNSVGPTPNEITDRNRGQIGSNNLAQDLAGVARNTTQTEFDSLVDDDFEEMKGINFRDSPVGLFNRQNNIATGIIDKNITNRAYNAGTPQATAQFLAANNFPIPENLKQFLEVDTTTGKYVSKKSPNNFMSFMSNVPTPFNLAKKGLGAVFGANSNLSRKMRGVNEKTGKANTQAQYEANRDAASKQSRTDKMIDRINKGKTTRSNPRDAGTTKAQKNDISMALQESYRGGGSGGGGGGKSIVCTAMYQTTGLQDWAKAMKVWYIYQKRHLSDAHQEGYHLLFKPFVKGMHKSKIIRAIGAHVAKHRTQELKHIMFNSKSDTLGKIYNNILEPICYVVGKLKSFFKKK